MTATPTTSPASSVRQDLLARLGLPADADIEDVSMTHQRIVDFLDTAPDSIGGWAKRRRKEVDRIDSLLAGSDADLAALARPTATPPTGGRRRIPRPLLVLGGALVAVGLAIAVYFAGQPAGGIPGMTSAQTPSAAPSAAATVDPAKLAELMGKAQANPADVDSLLGISDLYFGAGDFPNARTFADKVLVIDPKNEKALIGAGAAAFNAGDTAAAEKYWVTGVKEYPNNPELHYDLGFVYMTTNRTSEMQAEWAKVIELAPTSQMAKNVSQHVGSTKASAAPTATPSK